LGLRRQVVLEVDPAQRVPFAVRPHHRLRVAFLRVAFLRRVVVFFVAFLRRVVVFFVAFLRRVVVFFVAFFLRNNSRRAASISFWGTIIITSGSQNVGRQSSPPSVASPTDSAARSSLPHLRANRAGGPAR